MSTSRKIIAGLAISAATVTAGFTGVSAQSSDAVDLGPRIERACLRIPNLQIRTQNVLTRINGDSDTIGSLMWLDAKIEEATAEGREQRVEVLTNRRGVDPSWFTTVDLADLVEEVVAQAGRRSGGLTIAGATSFDAVVWPDGVRLALDNLIRNALTHGRSGTGVSADGGETAGVVVTIDAECSALIVDDAGPGIACAHRDRLVQPFERGVANESGSGLGLAFVDRVAVAHGGRLVLEDSPLGGLRATLVLGADGQEGGPWRSRS